MLTHDLVFLLQERDLVCYYNGADIYTLQQKENIKAYIRETREHGLILGDKYISHDLVPSFYLADEQTPVCRDIAGSGICKGNSK